LCQHQNILFLELRNLNIRDISFIEKQHRLLNLRLSGCPIEDYSPLLRIKPLDYLEIDEKAVEAIGMENLIKHHPDAVIEVQQKIDNRKI
jgi:Leucine-rich repeat (LRR) protein